ncbi:hypothetical protein N7448_007028 [Penicillium atrosanguineum]|nr:hypothetical protein N7448_007028 [Penicillium atrosanguineum]
MFSATPTSQGPGHHRRQLSTPAYPEAATFTKPVMAGNQPHRAHRRGQTVDYGYTPQVSAGRRPAPKTVPELRDYFNEKSGYMRQARPTQQAPAYIQAQQPFIQAALPMEDAYQTYPPQWTWSREELQELYQASASSSSPAPSIAPALSRSASECSDNQSPLKTALHRMRQEQQHNISMAQQAQMANYRPMQQSSIQPETMTTKMDPYLSYTSPLTPNATPLKSSFDFPMYSNEQTPTKSQSFSFPRTPVSIEMQRAHSLQGVTMSSPIQSRLQMPSPAESSIPYTEMAAMPSPSNADISETPSICRIQQYSMSPASSPMPEHEQPAGGMSEVDLDARVRASVRNTGISNEKIAEYISGPDSKDGKYVCLYDGCNCRFGRKENIKSHVQTHLDDRPYQCDVCDKLFVRGHDLKRHLKTHTGKKPFECRCGASFARHDALTRHRQRDMCVGGVTGFVPKTTRRGRPPKKSRPDIETRQTKSTRTRQRVAEKVSFSPVKMEEIPLQQAPVFNSPNYAPSSAMSSFTPPTSPGQAQSPNHVGTSLISQLEDDMLPPPLSPPQMAHARYEQAISQFIPGLTAGQENFYSDRALSPHDMSSPRTAPTLDEYTSGSEIDLFISQDSSEQVRHEFANMSNNGLSDFSAGYFVDSSGFPPSSMYSTFPEKSYSGLSTLDESYVDQIDTLSQEFLNDP